MKSLKQFLRFLLYSNPHFYYRRQLKYFTETKLPEKYKSKKPVTFIMEDRQDGFFSLFHQVLGALSFCQANGHNLELNFRNGSYIDAERGSNWWRYYFESSSFFNQQTATYLEIGDIEEQYEFAHYGRDLHPRIAHKLIKKMNLRKEISSKVSNFVQEKFSKQSVIGIHYRGTDKVETEAIRVPYDYILKYLEKFSDSPLIFLATDETRFLEFMRRSLGDRIIYYDAIRSCNNDPIHLSSNKILMYKAGEDALIDCLLLSKCKLILRTASNLSHTSSFFNPSLQTVDLTKEYLASESSDFNG